MTGDIGGGAERLAPVTPLFGPRGAAPARQPEAPSAEPHDAASGAPAKGASAADVSESAPAAGAPVAGADDRTWHTTWTAPIADRRGATPLHPDAGGEGARRGRGFTTVHATPVEGAASPGEIADAGEAALLRKLRTRSLSEREARDVLREREVDQASADEIVERFVRHGYLDDAKLAEQLVHTATERKGQGSRAIARTLAGRGIPRDVVDAALADLPDDEFERALEFARSKARSMRDLDREVALRRLSGQLARRGYGAHALEAARRALDEPGGGRMTSVRFT